MPIDEELSHGNNQTVDDHPPTSPPVRRSTCETRTPSYLQDYHCKLVTCNLSSPESSSSPVSTSYPLHQYLSYDKFSLSHRSFQASISYLRTKEFQTSNA